MASIVGENSIRHPVAGVKQPKADSKEGKTPALGDHQARALLDAPDPATLKGKRDRAVLAVLLYRGLRREELCLLKVRDIHDRRGVPHLRMYGKGNKLRYVRVHPASAERIHAYLEVAGHGITPDAPLFQPLRSTGASITADGIYKCVLAWAAHAKIAVDGFGKHGLRATAATNALEHEVDIARVQVWLGHATISTTRPHDHRKDRPEDSPTFKVAYSRIEFVSVVADYSSHRQQAKITEQSRNHECVLSTHSGRRTRRHLNGSYQGITANRPADAAGMSSSLAVIGVSAADMPVYATGRSLNKQYRERVKSTSGHPFFWLEIGNENARWQLPSFAASRAALR